MKVIKVNLKYNDESLSGPALGSRGQPGDEEPGRLFLSPTQPSWVCWISFWSQAVPQLQVPHLHTCPEAREGRVASL